MTTPQREGEVKDPGWGHLVEMALAEDRVDDDVTTAALSGCDRPVVAEVVAKAPGVLSGTPVFRDVFFRVDSGVVVTSLRRDGDEVAPGEVVMTLRGMEGAILRAERTGLNFLQRLSGIATLTRRFVLRLAGTGVTLLDTRKTTPGMRMLEKKAVLDGGGRNHRLDLAEMAMIKDNHIRMAGSITRAVRLVREYNPDIRIEVETQDMEQFGEAMLLDVDVIMLDNFSDSMVKQAVTLNRGKHRLELSGNVTLENISSRAVPGIDFISVGALTHSFRSLDISLEIRPQGKKEPNHG